MSLICRLHHLLGIRHTPSPYPANLLPAAAMCLMNVRLKRPGHLSATCCFEWVLANREKVSRKENISESFADQLTFRVGSSCSCTVSASSWHWKYTLQCLIPGDVFEKNTSSNVVIWQVVTFDEPWPCAPIWTNSPQTSANGAIYLGVYENRYVITLFGYWMLKMSIPT